MKRREKRRRTELTVKHAYQNKGKNKLIQNSSKISYSNGHNEQNQRHQGSLHGTF